MDTTLYLSAEVDLSDQGGVFGFGYEGIPADEYVVPEGNAFLRCTTDDSGELHVIDGVPAWRKDLEGSDFSGAYSSAVGVSYWKKTSRSGDPYASFVLVARFAIPDDAPSGKVVAFARVDCTGGVAPEPSGGGAGYVLVSVAGARIEVGVVCHVYPPTAQATFTIHLVGSTPPGFWTKFRGCREV